MKSSAKALFSHYKKLFVSYNVKDLYALPVCCGAATGDGYTKCVRSAISCMEEIL